MEPKQNAEKPRHEMKRFLSKNDKNTIQGVFIL
jgi:hypothetical protein